MFATTSPLVFKENKRTTDNQTNPACDLLGKLLNEMCGAWKGKNLRASFLPPVSLSLILLSFLSASFFTSLRRQFHSTKLVLCHRKFLWLHCCLRFSLKKYLILLRSGHPIYNQSTIIRQRGEHPGVSGRPFHSVHAVLVFIKRCYDPVFCGLAGPEGENTDERLLKSRIHYFLVARFAGKP